MPGRTEDGEKAQCGQRVSCARAWRPWAKQWARSHSAHCRMYVHLSVHDEVARMYGTMSYCPYSLAPGPCFIPGSSLLSSLVLKAQPGLTSPDTLQTGSQRHHHAPECTCCLARSQQSSTASVTSPAMQALGPCMRCALTLCAAGRAAGARVPGGGQAGRRALVVEDSLPRSRAHGGLLQHLVPRRLLGRHGRAGRAPCPGLLHLRGDAGLRAPPRGGLLPPRWALRPCAWPAGRGLGTPTCCPTALAVLDAPQGPAAAVPGKYCCSSRGPRSLRRSSNSKQHWRCAGTVDQHGRWSAWAVSENGRCLQFPLIA